MLSDVNVQLNQLYSHGWKPMPQLGELVAKGGRFSGKTFRALCLAAYAASVGDNVIFTCPNSIVRHHTKQTLHMMLAPILNVKFNVKQHTVTFPSNGMVVFVTVEELHDGVVRERAAGTRPGVIQLDGLYDLIGGY